MYSFNTGGYMRYQMFKVKEDEYKNLYSYAVRDTAIEQTHQKGSWLLSDSGEWKHASHPVSVDMKFEGTEMVAQANTLAYNEL